MKHYYQRNKRVAWIDNSYLQDYADIPHGWGSAQGSAFYVIFLWEDKWHFIKKKKKLTSSMCATMCNIKLFLEPVIVSRVLHHTVDSFDWKSDQFWYYVNLLLLIRAPLNDTFTNDYSTCKKNKHESNKLCLVSATTVGAPLKHSKAPGLKPVHITSLLSFLCWKKNKKTFAAPGARSHCYSS